MDLICSYILCILKLKFCAAGVVKKKNDVVFVDSNTSEIHHNLE